MKYKLFEEYNEDYEQHPGFFKTKNEILKWLIINDKQWNYDKYTINDDWSIDVKGKVEITSKSLIDIRVNFNEVNGDFDCSSNQLRTLKGCPSIVKGSFNCSYNHDELESLKGAPDEVHGAFLCSYNKLITLEHSPTIVKGDFKCSRNKLQTLKGAPNEIHGDFGCGNNKLITFQYAPDYIDGDFTFTWNKNLITHAHKSKINGKFITDGGIFPSSSLQGTLKERWDRYIDYLETLDEEEKQSSLMWLYDVDEEFRELVVKYAAYNDIDLPGVNMDIAKDASKHKDSGLF